ncbi:alpha/beta fold hydrolase [Mucilaginibacter sp. L3T2-6]|uniref:alpha/beta fold hydrolase n=1 Tax=Mucilaginibacter sp. L3T2-6 TaxID=3062491 RepID=UPI00267457C9|nr:alpha/beta hydrolase [Mucilaginibacter sp. L3T2-6]MDO3644372.1 alpha/beta hydrolase [Mucilaginibacter sp. L3T2-6]MDV6216824.1 alpha/beta hydrolase [Mucilaginibacter sp. L3T2-6]
MKTLKKMLPVAMMAAFLLCSVLTLADPIKPASPPPGFRSQYATVNGVKIHYVTGGKGEPLLLIHGFGQNWYMWNRLMPELAKHFTLVVPDMRGVGESGKPAGGYDKKNMAVDMHELMKKLGYKQINLAGHDIGLMVAYAYAAQFPSEVKKLALMDALLPGIEPVWSQVKAQAWWFGFFAQPHSGELVSGKVGLFFTDFWPTVGFQKNAFTQAEKTEFIRAYSVPGATTGAFHWFGEFNQDAKDNAVFAQTKLTMPLLAVGSDHFAGTFLAEHCRLVATNVKEAIITDSGHWVVQEQTAQVKKALTDFFTE